MATPRLRMPHRNGESDKRYFLKMLPKWIEENAEVDESTPKLNGKHCRLFKSENYAGYYHVSPELRGRKRTFNVHVLAYFADKGELPPEKWGVIKHECDTPRCVEPKHLGLGSQKGNMKDMDKRNRRHSSASTPPEELRMAARMRELLYLNDGMTMQEAAEKVAWPRTGKMAQYAITSYDYKGRRYHMEANSIVPPYPRLKDADRHTRIFLYNFKTILANAIAATKGAD